MIKEIIKIEYNLETKSDEMGSNKLLNMLSYLDENDVDEIRMILSNSINMGSANEASVSAKQFDKIVKDVLEWHKRKNESKQNA